MKNELSLTRPAYTGFGYHSCIVRMLWHVGSIVLLWLPATHVLASCVAPDLLSPLEWTIRDARPVISWAPVASASSYDLRLASRVPEGAVVTLIDTRVDGTSFQPPQPLSQGRSIVRLEITSRCGDASSRANSSTVRRFLIDTESTCEAPNGLQFVHDESQARLTWTRRGDAERYEVSVFDFPTGQLRQRSSTEAIDIVVSRGTSPRGIVAAVRSVCNGRYSQSVFARL